jgi:hypothetical protein
MNQRPFPQSTGFKVRLDGFVSRDLLAQFGHCCSPLLNQSVPSD